MPSSFHLAPGQFAAPACFFTTWVLVSRAILLCVIHAAQNLTYAWLCCWLLHGMFLVVVAGRWLGLHGSRCATTALLLQVLVARHVGSRRSRKLFPLRMAMSVDRLFQKLQSTVPSLVSLTMVASGWLIAVCGLLPWWSACATQHQLGLTCSVGLFFASFFRAVTTDPGTDADWNSSILRSHTDSHFPRERCVVCNADKHERVCHCRQCERCVLRMDHHCNWIRNCVGLHNHKFFLCLVVWQMVASVHYLYVYVLTIHGCINRKEGVGLRTAPRPNDGWLMWGGVLAMYATLDVLLTSMLLAFHVVLIGYNQTELECIYPTKNDDAAAGRPSKVHAPPEGCSPVARWRWMRAALQGRTYRAKHYKLVLGADWWFWFVPTHPRLGCK